MRSIQLKHINTNFKVVGVDHFRKETGLLTFNDERELGGGMGGCGLEGRERFERQECRRECEAETCDACRRDGQGCDGGQP